MTKIEIMIQLQSGQLVVFRSALFQTTSTLIQTEDLILLADPNWLPEEIEAIKAHLASIKRANDNRPFYLLFTHSDYDHILGYRAFPGAKVIASKAFAENPDKDAVVEQILKWDDEYYITRNYPIEYPAVDVAVHEDGQTLTIGNTQLTFYLSPGHNPDGIFTLLEWPESQCLDPKNGKPTAGVWLAGDYLCEVEFPYIYHSSRAYEETLSKVEGILKHHRIDLLIPGHGDFATSHEEILKRKKVALSYIHTLRKCLKEGTEFDISKLWRRYQFKRGMEGFHIKNVELIDKELAESHTSPTT